MDPRAVKLFQHQIISKKNLHKCLWLRLCSGVLLEKRKKKIFNPASRLFVCFGVRQHDIVLMTPPHTRWAKAYQVALIEKKKKKKHRLQQKGAGRPRNIIFNKLISVILWTHREERANKILLWLRLLFVQSNQPSFFSGRSFFSHLVHVKGANAEWSTRITSLKVRKKCTNPS